MSRIKVGQRSSPHKKKKTNQKKKKKPPKKSTRNKKQKRPPPTKITSVQLSLYLKRGFEQGRLTKKKEKGKTKKLVQLKPVVPTTLKAERLIYPTPFRPGGTEGRFRGGEKKEQGS